MLGLPGHLDAALLRHNNTTQSARNQALLRLPSSLRHVSAVSHRAGLARHGISCAPLRPLWSPAATEKEPSLDDGGNGSGGAGSSGGTGSGGGGGGGGDADGNGGLGRNIWVLVLAAAAALGLFKVGSQKLKQRTQQSQGQLLHQVTGDSGAARTPEPGSDDFSTLTRLTQEAFAELVKVKARLDELEEEAGIASSGAAPAGASLVSGSGGGDSSSSSSSGGKRSVAAASTSSAGGAGTGAHGRHRPVLSGVLRLGGGLMWDETGAASTAGEALQAAGVKLGTDVLMLLSGRVRNGRDSVHAECQVNPATEQLTLRKVLYNCRLGSHLRMMLAPFGARGSDAAYTLNPLAGQGLTSMMREGSPLHCQQLGSLIGIAVEASRAWINAGYFARASAAGTTASSLLAQAIVAPTTSLSAGLTYVEHRSEAGAPASTAAGGGGGVAGGVRQLVGAIERLAALTSYESAATSSPAASSSGNNAAGQRQVGATLACRLGSDAVLHAWAAADVERSAHSWQFGSALRPQWGVVLGSYPDGSGSGWALGVGRSAAADARGGGSAGGSSDTGSGAAGPLLPNLYEISLQFNMGDGLLLTPGMLMMVQGGKSTALLGMRTAWTF